MSEIEKRLQSLLPHQGHDDKRACVHRLMRRTSLAGAMIRDHVRHYKSAPGTQIFHDLGSENREIKRTDGGCDHTIAIFMADRYAFRGHIKFAVTDAAH